MPWLAARRARAIFGGGPLFLMPSTKVFFPFLEKRFPHLAGPYREMYAHSAYLGPGYKAQLRERVARIANATASVPRRSTIVRTAGRRRARLLFPLQ